MPQNPDSRPREAVDYVCCFSSNRKPVTVFKLVLTRASASNLGTKDSAGFKTLHFG